MNRTDFGTPNSESESDSEFDFEWDFRISDTKSETEPVPKWDFNISDTESETDEEWDFRSAYVTWRVTVKRDLERNNVEGMETDKEEGTWRLTVKRDSDDEFDTPSRFSFPRSPLSFQLILTAPGMSSPYDVLCYYPIRSCLLILARCIFFPSSFALRGKKNFKEGVKAPSFLVLWDSGGVFDRRRELGTLLIRLDSLRYFWRSWVGKISVDGKWAGKGRGPRGGVAESERLLY